MARAAAVLGSPGQPGVRGYFVLEQVSFEAPTVIIGEITGLGANSKHQLAIHTFGDLFTSRTQTGSQAFQPTKLGGRFNPHCDSTKPPVGDLGQVEANADGRAYYRAESDLVRLIGPQSVIGRSLVVVEDDGDVPLVFGVIGISMQQ